MHGTKFNFSKRAISPLIATILLIAFAVLIGTATMNWGKSYATNENIETRVPFGSAMIINIDKIDSPLKELQIKFITDKISLDDYLEEERKLLNQS